MTKQEFLNRLVAFGRNHLKEGAENYAALADMAHLVRDALAPLLDDAGPKEPQSFAEFVREDAEIQRKTPLTPIYEAANAAMWAPEPKTPGDSVTLPGGEVVELDRDQEAAGGKVVALNPETWQRFGGNADDPSPGGTGAEARMGEFNTYHGIDRATGIPRSAPIWGESMPQVVARALAARDREWRDLLNDVISSDIPRATSEDNKTWAIEYVGNAYGYAAKVHTTARDEQWSHALHLPGNLTWTPEKAAEHVGQAQLLAGELARVEATEDAAKVVESYGHITDYADRFAAVIRNKAPSVE